MPQHMRVDLHVKASRASRTFHHGREAALNGAPRSLTNTNGDKQPAALIALYAGWMLTAANATTYEDIAGQWCGDVTDYVFAPNTLTVNFTTPDLPMCSRSQSTPTPTTAYAFIGLTVPTSW
jgi:hypothetical protein